MTMKSLHERTFILVSRKTKSLLLVITAILGLPSVTFALPPLVEVSTAGGSWDNDPFRTVSAGSGFVSTGTPATRSSFGVTAQGEASCAAGFGVLRAYSTVQSAAVNGGGVTFLSATAKFRDNRITNAPGREGQSGFVTIKYTVTGSRSLQAPFNTSLQPGISESDAAFYIRGNDPSQPLLERHDRIRANGDTSCGSGDCTPYLNVEQTFTYPVTFGTAYDFRVDLVARVVLWNYNGFFGNGTVNLGHTMTWGGIVSVTDSSGNPITNYTDTSASGTNYMLPITPVCATPPASLAGWWPGDNHPRDIQSANNGTLENGATYATGRVSQAFSFPGVGARVRVSHAAAIDFNATQDYTIDFWMKSGPQSGTATLVEKNGGTYPYSVRLLPSGNVSAALSDATSTISVTSTGTAGKVDDNLWHHVAVVFRHSTKVLELYVEGSLNASHTYTETLGSLANGQDVYFGARSDGSNSLNGLIDEVDIFSGALSLAEIQSIAAAADLGKCRAPVVATGAVSRKTHGAAGDFDVALPLTGTPGVECRAGGATRDYQVVVTFADAVEVTGTPQAAVTSGTGDIGSGGVANGGFVTTNGSVVTIPLTNVSNAQNLVLTLLGVSNGPSTADVTIPMGMLLGDTNGNGAVSGSDIGQVKASSGQAVGAGNFRLDLNVSGGSIGSSDIGLVKSFSGTQLPSAAAGKAGR